MSEDVAAIASGLTPAQRNLIPHMSDGELVYPLATTLESVPLAIAEARKAVRGLRAIGLAQYGPLYNEDEGHPQGSGTWLTPLGLLVKAHITKGADHE